MNLKSDKNVSKLDELLKKIEGVQEREYCLWYGMIRHVSFEQDCLDNDIMSISEVYMNDNITVERIIEVKVSDVEQKEGLNTRLLNALLRKYDQFFMFPMGCNEENTQDGAELDVINIEYLYNLSRKVFCGFLGNKRGFCEDLVGDTYDLLNNFDVHVKLNIC